MSDFAIHDLAVAYAQAKLLQYQQEHPKDSLSNDELRFFLKAYDYASYQMPIEYEGFDEHF